MRDVEGLVFVPLLVPTRVDEKLRCEWESAPGERAGIDGGVRGDYVSAYGFCASPTHGLSGPHSAANATGRGSRRTVSATAWGSGHRSRSLCRRRDA